MSRILTSFLSRIGGPGPEKKNKIAQKKSKMKLTKSRRTRNYYATKKHFQKFLKSIPGQAGPQLR